MFIELRKREEMAELQAYFFLFLSLWSAKIVNFNFIPKFFD